MSYCYSLMVADSANHTPAFSTEHWLIEQVSRHGFLVSYGLGSSGMTYRICSFTRLVLP